MTLDEAIKFNQALEHDLKGKGMLTYAQATRLGIEALKLLINLRSGHDVSPISLLPGETEE